MRPSPGAGAVPALIPKPGKTVSELMGHAGTRAMLGVYTHASDARKREAAERIAARLSFTS